jgi:ATP-dependent RNA helicase RhlE
MLYTSISLSVPVIRSGALAIAVVHRNLPDSLQRSRDCLNRFCGLHPPLQAEQKRRPLPWFPELPVRACAPQLQEYCLNQSFTELGLVAELVRAVTEEGYTLPTPVQAQAIPVILAGRDVLAGAQTGTGKTAAFTLPMLQLLSRHTHHGGRHAVRALVLTPTRELAAQVEESIRTYGKHMSLRSTLAYGGVGIGPQIDALKRGVDILVATPGRLLDHVGQKTVNLAHVEILVLDEADRMLDMGFIHDIRKVLALLPKNRQNLLFSATFSDEIQALAGGLLRDPAQVQVAPRNAESALVTQRIHPVDQGRKRALLAHLVRSGDWHQVLVFTRTKRGANRLAELLCKDGIEAAAIHGNKSQGARTRALGSFKAGELRVLVATDLAARGLDIEELPHVVNYELPNVPEQYVHRIGRTGRAGVTGEALSLVSPDEYPYLADIEKLLGRRLEREIIPGFEPGTAPSSGDEQRRAQQHSRHQAQQPSRQQQRSRGQPLGAPAITRGRRAGQGQQPRRGKQQPNHARDGQPHQRPMPGQRATGGDPERQPISNATALFPSSGAVFGHGGGHTGQRNGRQGSRGRRREVPALLSGWNRRGG